MKITGKMLVFGFAMSAFALAPDLASAAKYIDLDGTGKHWGIWCADGALFSYSGSADGLDIVAGALCQGHGGMMKWPGGPTAVNTPDLATTSARPVPVPTRVPPNSARAPAR